MYKLFSARADVGEADRFRAASHFANLLEYDPVRSSCTKASHTLNVILMSRFCQNYSVYEIYATRVALGSVLAGLFFSSPWILYPAGIAGLGALCWSIPHSYHFAHLHDEYLKYSSPAAGAALHGFYGLRK